MNLSAWMRTIADKLRGWFGSMDAAQSEQPPSTTGTASEELPAQVQASPTPGAAASSPEEGQGQIEAGAQSTPNSFAAPGCGGEVGAAAVKLVVAGPGSASPEKRQYLSISRVGMVRKVNTPIATLSSSSGLPPATTPSQDRAQPAPDAYHAISWTGNKPGRQVDVEKLLASTRRKGLLDAAPAQVKMGQAIGSGLADRQELDDDFFALLAGEVNRALRLRMAEMRNMPKPKAPAAVKAKATANKTAQADAASLEAGKESGSPGRTDAVEAPRTGLGQE